MKKAMKMKMVSDVSKERRYNRDYRMPRDEFGDRRNEYDYHPNYTTRGDYDEDIYGAFRDRNGRRHYDNGKFAPRSNYRPVGFDLGDREIYDTYIPPIYNKHHEKHNEYQGVGYAGKNDDEYYLNAKFRMGEGKSQHRKLDKQTAEQWVSQMEKPDKNGKGGKWNYEQTTQIMKERNLDVDPVVFFATMNMIYSDYGKTLAKHNVNSIDLYIDLAMDWIEDDDVVAGDAKTALYYYYVVK